MKYEKEYKDAENKEAFITNLINKYKVKRKTALNRYGELKKIDDKKKDISKKRFTYVHLGVTSIPSFLKMLEIDDMKRYKFNITRKLLRTNGWIDPEIDYIMKENIIEKDFVGIEEDEEFVQTT